jgi:hypothetical protein
MFLVVLCTGCAVDGARPSRPSSSPATPTSPSTSLPEWLRARIGEYKALPVDRAPLGIWRITHKGRPAYYVQSPCCDQFDPLYDAAGAEVCNPSGGFAGRGDGKCPNPMDQGTTAALVWSHPAATPRTDDPPGLRGD